MQFVVNTTTDLVVVANELIKLTQNHKTFCFFGNLGAGKTTLIAAICKQLGIDDEISSPTYSIIQEYIFKQEKICHIDLYRLSSIEEALDIGIETILYEHLCFIEWADDFLEIIPKPFVSVSLQQEQNIRIIDINIVH